MAFSQKVLDLEFLLAYSGRFVPVNLGKADSSILQSYPGYSLTLSPTSTTIQLPEPGHFPDARANGERLDLRDFADDREVHASFCIIG
jgi:hypothetical protein